MTKGISLHSSVRRTLCCWCIDGLVCDSPSIVTYMPVPKDGSFYTPHLVGLCRLHEIELVFSEFEEDGFSSWVIETTELEFELMEFMRS